MDGRQNMFFVCYFLSNVGYRVFEIVVFLEVYRTIEMCIVDGFSEVLGAVAKKKFLVIYGLSLVFQAFFPIRCS
jgi:hypothetical protein